MDGNYTFIEHTADISMEVEGHTLRDLFTAAATGMNFYVFGAPASPSDPVSEDLISLDSLSVEELLVEWLSRILFISATKHARADSIAIEQLTETSLTARIRFRSAQAERDIKGVTWHNLAVEKSPQGYRVTITFDI